MVLRHREKSLIFGKMEAFPGLQLKDIRKNGPFVNSTIQFTTRKALEETSLKLLPRDTVLLCCTASVGVCALSEIELTTNQQFNGLIVKDNYSDRLLPKYLFHIASQLKGELLRLSGKTSFNFVSGKSIKSVDPHCRRWKCSRRSSRRSKATRRSLTGRGPSSRTTVRIFMLIRTGRW